MGMAGELRSLAIKQVANFVDTPDNLVKFLIDRVRSNLHVVLCMSPVSAKFPERARRFPGITGGCTIDWFLPWPKEALIAVSKGFIEQMTIECTPTVLDNLIVHMGMAHKIAVDVCDEYFAKMRRQVRLLARLEMLARALQALTSRHTNRPSCSSRCTCWPAWKCVQKEGTLISRPTNPLSPPCPTCCAASGVPNAQVLFAVFGRFFVHVRSEEHRHQGQGVARRDRAGEAQIGRHGRGEDETGAGGGRN